MTRTFKQLADHTGIFRGNAITDTQFSAFIRAHTQTECNGFTFAPGVLQDFDLKPFIKDLPGFVLRRVRAEAVDQSVILYKVRRNRANQPPVVYGYFLTDANHKRLTVWATGRSRQADDNVLYIEHKIIYRSLRP